jgi:hypothetical protein
MICDADPMKWRTEIVGNKARGTCSTKKGLHKIRESRKYVYMVA